MRQLIKDLIPHAPQLGLYVAPNVPSDKLDNALRDFAKDADRTDVIALYDATLMGSAKDGAVFTSHGLVFQNNDLEPVHHVQYADIVEVDSRRKLIGGRRVVMTVNRGRATFRLDMDFSGKPDAAQYVARFLKEAMLRDAVAPTEGNPGSAAKERTDPDAVREALNKLHRARLLTRGDMDAMLRVIDSR